MPEFNELWDYIVKRSADICIPVVQDRAELEYVFNLMRGCTSYLEVGTAEGNSLYVLANAMPKGSHITYVDWAEKHTKDPRDFILGQLTDYTVKHVHGDSTDFDTRHKVLNVGHGDSKAPFPFYDVVLIDAGHESYQAAIDAYHYGVMAMKYIIFHDIKLPEVNKAFEWYARQRPECRMYKIVNSEHYGYGILECPSQ